MWPERTAPNLIINPSGTNPGQRETKMCCPAWWLLDASSMRGFPELLGDNVHIPGTDGDRPYGKDIVGGTYISPLQVCGDVNVSGGPAASGALQGLEENLDWLWENVGTPGPSAYREAVYVQPNGNEIPCFVQCKLQRGRQKGSEAWLAFECTVPAGRIE